MGKHPLQFRGFKEGAWLEKEGWGQGKCRVDLGGEEWDRGVSLTIHPMSRGSHFLKEKLLIEKFKDLPGGH